LCAAGIRRRGRRRAGDSVPRRPATLLIAGHGEHDAGDVKQNAGRVTPFPLPFLPASYDTRCSWPRANPPGFSVECTLKENPGGLFRIRCTTAGSALMFAFVNDATPFEIVTSPGPSVVFTTIEPLQLLAHSWMYAIFTVDPVGRPVMLTTKVTVAEVMLPAPSLVVTNVIEALPCTTDSPFVMAGISFAGEIEAENVGLVDADGDVELLLQPTANKAAATASIDTGFIVGLSF